MTVNMKLAYCLLECDVLYVVWRIATKHMEETVASVFNRRESHAGNEGTDIGKRGTKATP
jgi:hypothetical protein